jgi:UDP-N-acetyl-D-galactosamine dehydrogenase
LSKQISQIRNTHSIDTYHEFLSYGIDVDVYDPWADRQEVLDVYGINSITKFPEGNNYGAIVLAVAHNEFRQIDLASHKSSGTIIFDVKGILDKNLVDQRL